MPTSAMPIDTQQMVHELTAAGISQGHAAAMVSVIAGTMERHHVLLFDVACTKCDLDHAVAGLNARNNAVDTKIDAVAAQLDAKIDAVAAQLDAKIDAVAAQLDAKIDAIAAQLDAKIDALAARLDAKIDAVAARLDAKIDALAAQLDAQIGAFDAKIDVAISKLKSELIMWIVSAGLFQSGLIVALMLNIAD